MNMKCETMGSLKKSSADQCFATATAKTRDIPAEEAWFAGGVSASATIRKRAP
jgi:hypothetical protein